MLRLLRLRRLLVPRPIPCIIAGSLDGSPQCLYRRLNKFYQDTHLSFGTPQQLSLSVNLSDDATFENFYAAPGSRNAEVLAALRHQVEQPDHSVIYIWGAQGVGLSHLLQAGCHYAQSRGLAIQYLPLTELSAAGPDDVFSDLETLDYVALDDVDAIVGKSDWEFGLFKLYNHLRDHNKRLVMAARKNVHELPLKLEDLRSRLHWGLIYQVESLTDEDKCCALQARARARGLDLGEEVAHYLIQRLPRHTHDLFRQLHQLDCASLAEQRKLTIPFVKKTLDL
jgi:DnaA family protein